MRNVLTLFILVIIGLNGYAQSNDVLAKSYFLKAQENYSEGNNASALENLDKTLEYLGSTNAKIEALYVKIALNQYDYLEAEKHLNNYFEIADESRSDYMEMLNQLPEIKEKAKEINEFLNTVDLSKIFTLEGFVPVKFNNKIGFVDRSTRKLMVPFKYDRGFEFFRGRAIVAVNSKYGHIDTTGKEIVPLKYDYVRNFSEGLACVGLNGKYGFVDKNGKEVIPLKFDDKHQLSYFREGLALMRLHGKWYWIDATGEIVFRNQFSYPSHFYRGLASVTNDRKKYGYINRAGELVIPLEFDSVNDFNNDGRARVSKNRKYFYIDKFGRRVE